jgi:oligopeptide/dipeptide ABC transporter ATP-binding protein
VTSSPAVLETRGLAKHYALRVGLRRTASLHAADDVSIAVPAGETLALVGESGSGKSTVGRCVLRLEEPSAGDVLVEGRSIVGLGGEELRHMRARMQMVFQDPLDSLNPRHPVGEQVAEPMWLHGVATKRQAMARVEELFATVGLGAVHLRRLPHQLSGGQQQRVGIARALASEPRLVVLDEPTSALDVSVQAQIVNLLQDLQAATGIAFLFISHDLAVVSLLAQRVAVMYLGQIVELGRKEVVLGRPSHPYTEALISAVPVEMPGEVKHRVLLGGEPASAIEPPRTCRLANRCPYVRPVCREQPAELVEVVPGHHTRCIRFQQEHHDGIWEPTA